MNPQRTIESRVTVNSANGLVKTVNNLINNILLTLIYINALLKKIFKTSEC